MTTDRRRDSERDLFVSNLRELRSYQSRTTAELFTLQCTSSDTACRGSALPGMRTVSSCGKQVLPPLWGSRSPRKGTDIYLLCTVWPEGVARAEVLRSLRGSAR